VAIGLISTATVFQFGSCIPGEFTAVETTSVTLDGRTVITSLINSIIIAPLQGLVETRVNNFFDNLLDEDE
jgi:hypothetical protein